MLGFAALTPTYLEHAARMRFGGARSDFFRDDYLRRFTPSLRVPTRGPVKDKFEIPLDSGFRRNVEGAGLRIFVAFLLK